MQSRMNRLGGCLLGKSFDDRSNHNLTSCITNNHCPWSPGSVDLKTKMEMEIEIFSQGYPDLGLYRTVYIKSDVNVRLTERVEFVIWRFEDWEKHTHENGPSHSRVGVQTDGEKTGRWGEKVKVAIMSPGTGQPSNELETKSTMYDPANTLSQHNMTFQPFKDSVKRGGKKRRKAACLISHGS